MNDNNEEMTASEIEKRYEKIGDDLNGFMYKFMKPIIYKLTEDLI